jgi:hypothetical protein
VILIVCLVIASLLTYERSSVLHLRAGDQFVEWRILGLVVYSRPFPKMARRSFTLANAPLTNDDDPIIIMTKQTLMHSHEMPENRIFYRAIEHEAEILAALNNREDKYRRAVVELYAGIIRHAMIFQNPAYLEVNSKLVMDAIIAGDKIDGTLLKMW